MTRRITSLVLSVVAGYVDTSTFVLFSGLFAAHVTGNFVLFAVAIGEGLQDEDYLKLIAFPVFIVAIFVTTWLHDRAERFGEKRSRALLWVVTAILLAVGGLGLLPVRAEAVHYALALALVAAMGIQNALHRLYAQLGPATTVMTGNVAQLTVSALRRLTGRDAAQAGASGTGFRELLWLVVGFAAGCGLAVPLARYAGLAAILLPALALAATLLAGRRMPAL